MDFGRNPLEWYRTLCGITLRVCLAYAQRSSRFCSVSASEASLRERIKIGLRMVLYQRGGCCMLELVVVNKEREEIDAFERNLH